MNNDRNAFNFFVGTFTGGFLMFLSVILAGMDVNIFIIWPVLGALMFGIYKAVVYVNNKEGWNK